MGGIVVKEQLKQAEEKMKKTISALVSEYGSIRAGSANASLLSKISVEYYGQPTNLRDMATISTPDPRTLYITPFDPSAMKEIEKAILASDLGINPQNDGKGVRLVIPPLTEERRIELGKQVSKKAEEAKVAIRSIRRDTIEKFKAMKKKSEITEDDLKSAEKDTQNIHDKYIKEIDKICAAKGKEIKEV